MKFLIFLALLGLFFGACQPTTTTPSTCQYQAYSTGSTFVYTTSAGDTTTETVLGDTVIDGHSCKKVRSHYTGGAGVTEILFADCENGRYIHRDKFVPGYNITVDSLVYFKDNLVSGDMWTDSYGGTFGGFTVLVEYEHRYIGTSTTRVVNGMTFNNVVQVEQKTYTTTFGIRQLTSTLNYWFGKGVGVIEVDGGGTKIVSYNIVP